MADEVEDGIENALNLVVITTERSGNMKKELKQTIYETVSTLRNLFMQLRNKSDLKTAKISALEAEVDKLKTHSQMLTYQAGQVQGEPSVIPRQELLGTRGRGVPSIDSIQVPVGPQSPGATSGIPRQELAKQRGWEVAPYRGGDRKLYSEALTDKIYRKKFKLTVKSNEQLPPDTIKALLKNKINPTKIKVGINTFKSLKDGRVLIETNSREELEVLEKDINAKCEGKLEANSHKLRNPRLVVINIPEEITTENLEDTLIAQNTDVSLTQGDIVTKFCYETRQNTRNLVIEVSAKTRKTLIERRLKLGWQICKIEDYVVATRCYKCSRYNHRARDCRGEETCPLCAGKHKLKECTTNPQEYKCINCLSYNKHNQKNTICVNHTSLDKSCPSLRANLDKNRRNTDY